MVLPNLAWLNFRFSCSYFLVCGFRCTRRGALCTSSNLADKVRDDHSVVYAKRFKLIHSLLFWLDWLPARVASFGYLVIGNFNKGTSCWLKYVLDFSVSNRKVVTQTALAAEQIEQQHFGCTYEAPA